MIAELRGTIVHKDAQECVIDVHGIGFQVQVSERTAAALGRIGEAAHLHTHLLVREDEWRLVGFGGRAERQGFMDLLSVNGVGMRVALAILGRWTLSELQQLVSQGQWKTLQEAPGVGAKLAQRLQIELASRWKVEAPVPMVTEPSAPRANDVVVDGLIGLGYSAEEAWEAVAGLSPGESDAMRLRAALKRLDRGAGGAAHA